MTDKALRGAAQAAVDKAKSSNTPVYIWAQRLLVNVAAALAAPESEKTQAHQWTPANEVVRWEHCSVCGVIRRRDDGNGPCKGAAPVRPRITAPEPEGDAETSEALALLEAFRTDDDKKRQEWKQIADRIRALVAENERLKLPLGTERQRAELDIYQRHIDELRARIRLLEAALEKCRHKAESMRIWNGMGWTYHPPAAKQIHDTADEILGAGAADALRGK